MAMVNRGLSEREEGRVYYDKSVSERSKAEPSQTPLGGSPATCHLSLPAAVLGSASTLTPCSSSSPGSAAGGEIFDQCVADNDDAFTEKDVIRLARQILSGVSFLHRNNVVHLDLKVSAPRPFSCFFGLISKALFARLVCTPVTAHR